jgi:hypothetical protein
MFGANKRGQSGSVWGLVGLVMALGIVGIVLAVVVYVLATLAATGSISTKRSIVTHRTMRTDVSLVTIAAMR